MEEIKEKIVNVFGNTSEDLNCANADTAIDEILEQDCNENPMNLLIDFIYHCNEFELKEIRQLMWENGNGLRIKIKGV